MNSKYYEAIDKLEKGGIDAEYINGWACGFMHNPKREGQRVTPAYDAGYQDGTAGKTDGSSAWKKK